MNILRSQKYKRTNLFSNWKDKMDTEDYLIKTRINQELDKMIAKSLKMFKESNGEKCKVCGVVQGEPLKGFKNYYCEHLGQSIDDKLKKWKDKVVKKVFGSVTYKKFKEVRKKDL